MIWWRIRVRHGIQRIRDLFLHFYRRSMSSSLCTAGRLIVLIRRHGIELRAARTKARKGRGSRYTVGFLVGVAVARCKIWDIYCSYFATRIWNSRQFNGEEFPFVCEIAIHLRNVSFQNPHVNRMPEFLNIISREKYQQNQEWQNFLLKLFFRLFYFLIYSNAILCQIYI